MMPDFNPLLVMLGAGAALAMGGACLFTLDRRARTDNQRIADVVLAYAPSAARAPGVRRPLTGRSTEAGTRAGVLAAMGIEGDRPDLYPVPWWVIVLVVIVFATVVSAFGVFFLGPVVWAALPIIAFLLVRSVFSVFRNRRASVLYAQLPDALAMIMRSVRAGITVQDSLRIVGDEGPWPTSTEFQLLNDEIRLGTPLQTALVRLAQRSALIEYRFFAVALALQSQSGGSLAEVLENLADVVRKRVALKQRAIALASEARMTMWVLGCLPFVTAGALLVVSPGYLMVLVTTSVGKKILLTGLVLLVLGFGSMQFIINKSVS